VKGDLKSNRGKVKKGGINKENHGGTSSKIENRKSEFLHHPEKEGRPREEKGRKSEAAKKQHPFREKSCAKEAN